MGVELTFFHCFLLFACRKFYLMVVRNDLTVLTFLFIFHYLFCVQVCFQVTLKTFEFNLNMPGRHCCVSGCSNGDNKLKKWKSGLCEVHSCHFGTARCTCGPPPGSWQSSAAQKWTQCFNFPKRKIVQSNALITRIHFEYKYIRIKENITQNKPPSTTSRWVIPDWPLTCIYN